MIKVNYAYYLKPSIIEPQTQSGVPFTQHGRLCVKHQNTCLLVAFQCLIIALCLKELVSTLVIFFWRLNFALNRVAQQNLRWLFHALKVVLIRFLVKFCRMFINHRQRKSKIRRCISYFFFVLSWKLLHRSTRT
jgi:hypothetical protein